MSNRALLTSQQAADFLGVGVNRLAKWRCAGYGPRYVKFGRNVRYAFRDLNLWLEGLTVKSTSQPPPGFAEAEGLPKTKDAHGVNRKRPNSSL